ncbi:MAG: hypothetical protein HOO91_12920 [Bacteroidales bacterium]|nr:hypothetical protein [Bacteroidales bacterium]
MKRKIFSFIVIYTLVSLEVRSQETLVRELFLKDIREFVVAIGEEKSDTVLVNGKKKLMTKFNPIGSGLLTYLHVDTIILSNIITARHIIDYFKNKGSKEIYIRPSYADTISTLDYFGIPVPIINFNKSPNTFVYPDSKIDLGAIILSSGNLYYEYSKKLFKKKFRIFPINSMTSSHLGDLVWICGYPDHIQSSIRNYCISTYKPGYIAWIPYKNMKNKDLNHITLIESNATFGNSGSPVFSLQEKPELIGILVAGYEEDNNVFDKSVISNSLIAKSRAGVSLVENAEYIKRFNAYIENELKIILKLK